jgi:D-alanyl-D-alanine carboxypeptidase
LLIELGAEVPEPQVTAQNWAIVDTRTGELLYGQNENEETQVASLTKIMTAHCVLSLCEELKSPFAEVESRVTILKHCS